MMRKLLRWIGAAIFVVALIAGMFFGVKARYGSYGDYYYVSVDLPRAGQLMRIGSDVRQRGVIIGKVSDIRLVDRRARLTLQIERQYRVPEQAQAYVGLKTLLGDKFIDLRYEEYAAPFLRDGAQVPGSVTSELEEVLSSGVEVFEAIPPADLATIISELAQGARGHGEDIARNLDVNAELSTLFAETLEPQIRGLVAFHIIFHELRGSGVDLNRLADAVNRGVPVYASERAQRHLRTLLERLVPMSNDLSDLLILNRADIDRMMDQGDIVLETIASRPGGLVDLVSGLASYVNNLGDPDPYPVPDGSAAAPFANFIGGTELEGTLQDVCGGLPPPVAGTLPICGQLRRES